MVCPRHVRDTSPIGVLAYCGLLLGSVLYSRYVRGVSFLRLPVDHTSKLLLSEQPGAIKPA